VRAIARAAHAEENVATTLVAAVVRRDQLYWISVGDSMLYLYRAGTLTRLSEAHTYGQELDRDASLGKISSATAAGNPERDALTSYVGIRRLEDIDEGAVPLFPGDKIIVASDGLYKTLDENEITAELSFEAQAACDSLIEKTLAKQRSRQDNVTVLCIELQAEIALDGATVRLPITAQSNDPSNVWEKFVSLLRRQRDT
jgi:protein phosphatase